jgi:alpha-L-fucosidase 2
MKTNTRIVSFILVLTTSFSAAADQQADPLTLHYAQPAGKWTEALPLGNGRLGAMVFGGTRTERIQLNEESLWAGEPVEAYAPDYPKHLAEVQRLVLAGDKVKAREYGKKHLTKTPTSFRSYEPLGDLFLDFGSAEKVGAISGYRRELSLPDAIARTTYRAGQATITRDVLISAPADALAIRVSTDQPGTLSFAVRLTRFKDATVTAHENNELHMDGQIVDIEKKDGGPEDNAGGSGPGGKHMRFAGRLVVRSDGGTVQPGPDGSLKIDGATTAVVLFTAATDYNREILNYDRSIDPAAKADGILAKLAKTTWPQLRDAHLLEHRAAFNRFSLDLGPADPERDAKPTDVRLAAVKKGGEDPGLVALISQYGRYLLLSSSRAPGRLPANLQGIWSDRKWAPWEADYHLNINLQMNYGPAPLASLD